MPKLGGAQVDLLGRDGQTLGLIANQVMLEGRLNAGGMRPFIHQGRAYVSVYIDGDPADKKSWRTIPVTNALLRRDEWKRLDDAVIKQARYRLGGVQDLIDNGLTYPLGNAMGTTVLEWHDVGGSVDADVTMDGVTRSKGDRPKFQTNYLPIPIIHYDYEINTRALEASRNMSNPLDTTMVEFATRAVNEKLENMLFTDTTYAFGATDDRTRNSIYSYVNFPDRNTATLGTAWDASAKTAQGILNDVKTLKQTSINAYHYGPWMLYIPTDYETVLDDDYDTTTPGKTIRSRILEVGGIKGIKVIDTLSDDTLLLVEMNPQTVRLVQGLGLTNVEWETEGKFVHKFKVLTIQVPQIRSDQNGKCGIVHMTTA